MAGNLTAMIASIFSGGVTPDPYYEYTTLLLPGNGTNGAQNNTFLDGSTNNFTITRNGNTTQGTFSPFSQTGWGNYFDGSGDYLSVADNTAWDFGSGNFTVECWYYPTTSNAQQVMVAQWDGVGGGTGLSWVLFTSNDTNRYLRFATSTNGSGASFDLVSTTSLVLNAWNHVAIVRNGNTFQLYLNGTAATGGSTTSAITLYNATNSLTIGATSSGTQLATGYLSNTRIVKGTAVYTGAFTPPTAPLTAISGTSLLTCQSNRFIDNSTNNFTITRNGDTRVVAFSPFNPTASWSAATYGGSGYFDGSGDYLNIANNSALGISSGNFTIEFWVNFNSVSSYPVLFDFRSAQPQAAPTIYLNNDSRFNYLFNSGTAVAFGPNPLVVGTWYHLAWVRSGTTHTIYVNGQSQTTFSDAAGVASSALNIAARQAVSVQDYFNGYISDFRFVKGTAVYTGNFTPPIAPITNAGSTSAASYPSTTNINTSFASSATSLLLNFTNAGIYDATSKNDLETVGNAQISTTQSKFGGSSISFDGTGDWLLIPDQPPQRIGTGNFTVEMWVYRNSSGTYGLAGKGTGTTGWLVSLNSSNQVVFTYGSSTITSSGTVSATTWTHIAVVREGTSTNQTKIYINGTNDGTGTVSTDFNQTNSIYIGADRTGGSAANAYVQDVRITNYARYTSNFTPPTAAFPTL